MKDGHRANLLVELGCEELPPLALDALTDAFFNGVVDGLAEAGFAFDRDRSRAFQSPRRMAVFVADLADRQPDRVIERKGPSVQAAFDADGQPTRAAQGFAASVGRDVTDLERLKTDKGEWLYCSIEEPGKPLDELLYPLLQSALGGLPVPRPMRWSDHDFTFVRPVHWLVVIHGDRVVPGSLYGCEAGRVTRGHRIHAPGDHELPDADAYAERLEALYVRVDADERRNYLRAAVDAIGRQSGGSARITPSLLDEVNNIVEWPVAVRCAFDEVFLAVPQEALVASMESHQKFFPILDAEGGLTSDFVVAANIVSKDEAAMAEGYERVIRPRLADARFFWEQDLKQRREDWLAALDGVVFQKTLGTVGDKTRRIESLSRKIAEELGVDAAAAARAGRLCKADLVSQMVGEFPELQGTMGAYTLAHDGEPAAVYQAVGEHYRPRFAGDTIPESPTGRVVALADRLDTLVGIFAAGLKPTGNKDPFALRRSALAVIRILEEAPFPVTLDTLVEHAARELSAQVEISDETKSDVMNFITERLRHHLLDGGATTRQVNAVLAAPRRGLPDLRARLDAVSRFMKRDEAEALIAANKRIGNILKKQDQIISEQIIEDRFVLAEEKALFDAVNACSEAVEPRFASGDYDEALARLAALRAPVDRYFDSVMVMDDDDGIRANRLAQLVRLKALFDQVADFGQAD
ncbi:MAG: glycine--tRNA ligase subunit beta [Xanthomonadales bacterium]|jgi:glycyl-tRNA synthetase beta chain|nr:glycine--tRNA ligase subunit beta [Xanthomonadales bacterium]